MNELLYTGMKVKVKHPDDSLCGHLRKVYEEYGYLYVESIYEDIVSLSECPHSGMCINVLRNNLEPIYNDNILLILENKRKQKRVLEKEIEDISEFIIQRCKDVNEDI